MDIRKSAGRITATERDNLSQDLDDVISYKNFGNIYMTMNDTVAAINNYQKVFKINPDSQGIVFCSAI